MKTDIDLNICFITVAVPHRGSLLGFTQALTADNSEYTQRLRLGLRQINPLNIF